MLRLMLLSFIVITAGPAVSAAALNAAANAAPQSSANPAHMLETARSAAQHLNYTGVYIYQRGNEVRSTRITHLHTASATQEKLDNLDGQPSETVRKGDELLTYLPRQRRLVIESRGHEPGFPGLLAINNEALKQYYSARNFGSERVAGRPVVGLALDARDRFHYSYRFWTDQVTGLLLRAQTLNEQAEVVEQVAFTQLSLGTFPHEQVRPSITDTHGWQIDNAVTKNTDLSAWKLGWVPGGFQRVGSVMRVMREAGAGKSGNRREVAQILYSDGLAGLSIFIEPWSPERSAIPLRLGALNMLGKRQGKFWLTIVGEVPMTAIRQVADSLEFDANSPR